MADDLSVAGVPEPGRSDLYARIQDLQDGVDSGLTAAQVDDAVRGAVAALLPGLVSDAVSSAVAVALPSVAHSVAVEVQRQLTAPDTDAGERREEIDALREDLADALDYVRTTLAADFAARTAETHSAVHALSGSLDALSQQLNVPDLTPVLERLDALPHQLPAPDLSPVHDQLAALAAGQPQLDDGDLEALHVRFDALLAAVDAEAEGARDRQAADTERLRAALADQLAAAADAPGTRVTQEVSDLRAVVVEAFEQLHQSVDARVSGLATAVSEQILDVRTDMATTAGETLSTLAAVRDRPQIDISDRLDAIAADVERLADLPPPVDHGQRLEVLSSGLTGLDDRIEGLHGRVADLDGRLDAQRADLVEAVRASQEATIGRLKQIAAAPVLSGALDLDRELEDLRKQLEAWQAHVRAAVDGLPPQIDAWRTESDEDRGRLSAALSGLERAGEEMAELVDRVGDQGSQAAATLHDASLGALDQLRSEAEAGAADLRRDGEAARAALDEHATASRQGAVDEVRTAVSTALDEVRAAVVAQAQETRAATGEMEQIAHRVQSAGRLVVGYLAERDAALEEVRDRDTVQLLEDVLSVLSRKEREKAAGQTRGILARRRDSRQAERWREHQEGHDDPDVDADDQALLELLDAPASRPHPGPGAAVPTAPTPTKEPAAKRAPAKKAPAKKAPAKNAPAKKAPAKNAPAKKAAAKKAPTKRAPATNAAPAADASTPTPTASAPDTPAD